MESRKHVLQKIILLNLEKPYLIICFSFSFHKVTIRDSPVRFSFGWIFSTSVYEVS